jgi:hypothetical protein
VDSFVVTPPTNDTIAGVTAIAAGSYHVCFLLSSSGVRCAGQGYYGQLGDGDVSYGADRATLGTTDILSNVTAIAAGPDSLYTCALLYTGSVRCWGDNEAGQARSLFTLRASTSNNYVSLYLLVCLLVQLGDGTGGPRAYKNVPSCDVISLTGVTSPATCKAAKAAASSTGLSTAAVVGIAVGASVGALLLIIILAVMLKRLMRGTVGGRGVAPAAPPPQFSVASPGDVEVCYHTMCMPVSCVLYSCTVALVSSC